MASSESLDGATCNRLCNEFAEITNTDSACGHFFLQDCGWDLQVALTRFFDSSLNAANTSTGQLLTNPKITEKKDPDHLDRLKFVSWNIDGLDDKNRKTRAKVVCEIIKREQPAIIFFQEVIKDNLQILTDKFETSYQIIAPSSSNDYFTAVFLLKQYIRHVDHKIIYYEATMMDRNLLQVDVEINGKPFVLLTSHLESTKNFKVTRIRQFETCINVIKSVPNSKTILFGGDLNIRDDEIKALPDNVKDLWVLSGCSQSTKFTWDCLKNDNLQMGAEGDGSGAGRFKPRCRFDRLYLRHSDQKSIDLEEFRLIGTERIRSCLCFPSDHFGICTEFKFL